MREIVLTFPFPDMKLASIHGNGHRFAKAERIRSVRRQSGMLAMTQASGMRFAQASIHYGFFMPDARTRDQANMIQACKPIIDGIVDAGLIAGDSWKELSIVGVSVEVCRANPRVEITLGELP